MIVWLLSLLSKEDMQTVVKRLVELVWPGYHLHKNRAQIMKGTITHAEYIEIWKSKKGIG